MEINWANVDAAIDYLMALREAKQSMDAHFAALNTPAVEPLDVEKLNASTQCKILANSGRKAEILGTISTEPTLDTDKMVGFGITKEVADAIKNGADSLRAWAEGLTK